MEEDRALRRQRLAQFLSWMVPVAVAFCALYVAAGALLRSAALLFAAVDVFAFIVALFVARRRLVRGDIESSAEVVALGLFVMCVIGAVLLPWLRAALLVIPLAGVALVLPDVEGQRLRRLLTIAFVSEVVILSVATWLPPLFTAPPHWLRDIVLVSASAIAIGLTFLLLYSDAHRLRRSIAVADFHALKLQAIVERVPIVVFALDRDAKFTLSEGHGLESFGLRPGEVVGRSVHTLYPDLEWLRSAVDRVLAGTEASATGAYGDRTLEVHLRPFESGAIGVAIDITDSRRLYEEARDAVRVRDEFLSVASHELKTPLTPLRLEATAIERALGRGDLEKVNARAARLQTHVDRLAKLVDELLDVGRIRVGRLSLDREPTDLSAIIRDVLARMEPELERAGCPVETELRGDTHGVWDPSRIDQIVTNLLSNAAKYGPGAPIRIAARDEGENVVLTVSDRGIGISPADQERIFGRFERAVNDRNYGGLGLGLFIVNELVKAHDGVVTVSSAPGEGSTFVVTLPRAERLSRAS